MSEPLFGQILPTVVADLFLGAPNVLLLPVIADFQEHQRVLVCELIRTDRFWTAWVGLGECYHSRTTYF
jgi:hypothetical protein